MKNKRNGLIECLFNIQKTVVGQIYQKSAQCGYVRSAGGGAPV